MKIGDDGFILFFLAIVVSIITINTLFPYRFYLLLSIGAIIFVFLFMFPLFSFNKDIEIDSLYSELHGVYEEIKLLKMKKRKSKKGGKTEL